MAPRPRKAILCFGIADGMRGGKVWGICGVEAGYGGVQKKVLLEVAYEHSTKIDKGFLAMGSMIIYGDWTRK